MGFWKELRERKVFRVAIIYALTGWALAQVADLVLPTFGAPEWVLKTIIFVLLLGFPLSLILAWALELTPDGVKISEPAKGQKRLYSISALLIVGISTWYLGYVMSPGDRPAGEAGSTSIAVLPFLDLSPEGDQDYFAQGIAEQLLDLLAKNTQLKVAARTSSFQFKSDPDDVTRIGELLRVNYLLEGSVRRAGERVRITAQLIDTRTGYHEWSETYTRNMTDIFDLQDEISREIADELEAQFGLADGDSPEETPEVDPAAYDQYLLGRHFMHRRTRDSLTQAVKHFERAVALEPRYGKAYAQLAICTWLLSVTAYGELQPAEVLERGWQYLEQARAHAPNEAETLAATGSLLAYDRKNEESIANLEAALARNPAYLEVAVWLSRNLAFEDPSRSMQVIEMAYERDPLNYLVAVNYAEKLVAQGRLEEAETLAERLFAIGDARGHQVIGVVRTEQGRYAEAMKAFLQSYAAETGTKWDLRGAASLLELASQLRALVELPVHEFGHVDAIVRTPGIIEYIESQEEGNEKAVRLMMTYALQGNWEAAIAAIDETEGDSVARLNSFEKLTFAGVLQNTGKTDRAAALFTEALAKVRSEDARRKAAGFDNTGFQLDATMMAACGRQDTGFCLSAIEQAMEMGLLENSHMLVHLPNFQSVQDEPRYIAVLEELRRKEAHIAAEIMPVFCNFDYPPDRWRPPAENCEEYMDSGNGT